MILICASSSRIRIAYPLLADFRMISMGTNTMGAYLAAALFLPSNHRSRPSARYNVLAPFSSIEVFAERYIFVRELFNSFSAYRECSLRCLLSSAIKSANSPRSPNASTVTPPSPAIDISAGRGITRNSSPSDNASSKILTSEDKSGTTAFVIRILISILRRLRSKSLRSHCVSFVTVPFWEGSGRLKISTLFLVAFVISFSSRSSC